MLISNIRLDGKPIGALPDGEMQFHTDQCHQETPAKATLLYAIEIPSQGGNTLFSNAYTAYETLPEEIKQRIAGRRALNAYDKDSTLRTASYDNAGSSYWHPAVRTHPATGRKALYVNRLMTREIEGLGRARRATRCCSSCSITRNSRTTYEHVWRPGDILMGQPLHLARAHGFFRRRAAPAAARDHPGREAVLSRDGFFKPGAGLSCRQAGNARTFALDREEFPAASPSPPANGREKRGREHRGRI